MAVFTCEDSAVSSLMSDLLAATEPGDTIVTDSGREYVRAQQYYWALKGTGSSGGSRCDTNAAPGRLRKPC
jgi:hypothetical protein